MYLRPPTVADALAARAQLPAALVVAGGTAVTPAMNAGRLRPGDVLDLGGLRDGQQIEPDAGRLLIGPAVSVAAAARHPALRGGVLGWIRGFATPAVRERATVIGNLFQHPRDLAVALAAVDGVMHVAHAERGARLLDVPAAAAGPGALAAAGELAVGLSVAVPERFAYARVAVREVAAPTLAAVAVSVVGAGPRVAVAGQGVCGPTGPLAGPLRRMEAETLLADAGAADAFAAAVVDGLDLHGTAGADRDYLAAALRTLARRCHRRVHGSPDGVRLPAA